MDTSIKSTALRACRHFMVPVARFLLGIGIGYREFAEISKLAFVQVASDDFGLRGRKTNISRVSVMTGLSRKEIRRVRDRLDNEDWSLDTMLSKPVSILSEWYTNPRYLNRDRTPKVLIYDLPDERQSFAELVREAGGDVPPGAMLKELQRAGCVEEVTPGRWKPVQREYSPRGIDVFQVQRFGECLHDLAQTITENYMKLEGAENRLFEFRAWSDRVDAKSVDKLKRIVAAQGKEYLDTLDDWMSEHSVSDEERPYAERKRCGVGVYYFESVDDSFTDREVK